MKNLVTPMALRGTLYSLLLTLALAPSLCPAQYSSFPPGQMSYQGFLVDGNGGPLATNAPKNYDVIFTIYDGPATAANPLWQELQTVTVDRGYFSVLLGQGGSTGGAILFTNNLTAIFASTNASDRYIGLTVKGLNPGGPDNEIQPRLRLLASPYCLLAANAKAIVDESGRTAVSVLNSNTWLTGTTISSKFRGDGSLLTNLNVNSFGAKITEAQLSLAMLGIGTAAPAWPLDVVANQAVGRFFSTNLNLASVIELKSPRLTAAGQHTLGAINFTTGNNSSDVTYRGQFNFVDNFDGSGYLRFQAGSATMYFNTAGNLGIGFPSATYKLLVYGDASIVGNLNVSGTVTQGSDRNRKTDFATVNPDEVLEAVGNLPIQQWRFKDEKDSIRHMGPMAQDFRQAFGLGDGETTIATVDSEGVALAAIKGLKQRTEAQAAELKAKDAEIQALKQSLAELKETVAHLAPVAK